MSKKDDLIWLLNTVAIVIGFILIMISQSELSHLSFVTGLLLVTVATYRYGYDRGVHRGRLTLLEDQKRKVTFHSTHPRKEEFISLIELLAIIIGFVLIMTAVSVISYLTFVTGILLFAVGTHQFGYRRGYGMGQIAQYEELRKKEST